MLKSDEEEEAYLLHLKDLHSNSDQRLEGMRQEKIKT